MDEPTYLRLADVTFKRIEDAFRDIDPDDVDLERAGDVITRTGVSAIHRASGQTATCAGLIEIKRRTRSTVAVALGVLLPCQNVLAEYNVSPGSEGLKCAVTPLPNS